MRPLPDHPTNCTSTTSSGRTQTMEVSGRSPGIDHALRRVGRERVQAAAERGQLALAEARADAAHVLQGPLRVAIADMQRADSGARAGRGGEAEHDELLAALALHLEPRLARGPAR